MIPNPSNRSMHTLNVGSTSGGPNFGGWFGASRFHLAGRLLSCGRPRLLCLWWRWSLFVD